MDLIFYLLVLVGTGVLVGFASGLLGVGGGFIMVPVQFFMLIGMGVDPDTALRVAFATSLAVILPTALSGAIGHWRHGAVLFWPAFLLGATGLIGGVSGAAVASHSPANFLSAAFGFLALFSAFWLFVSRNFGVEVNVSHSNYSYLFWGFIGGLASGLLGIGGGIIMVPILTILLKFPIHKAIGTSTAFIIFASLGGIISYVVNGIGVAYLPPYSLGYVNLLQFVILAGFSVPLARVGVKTAHNLPASQLRYVFAALLIFVALKMIGVFGWLHLPI